MISFKDVTKNYQLDEETTITPVKKLTLEIARGEFIVIIGRSGSGKTTLLNLAAGLVKPTTGEVSLNKLNLNDMTDKQLSNMRSQYLGFIFQFPSLLSSLTVLENVALPAIFGPEKEKKDSRERAANLISIMGLSTKMGVYPRQLSAGEQKRVVIARSLINHPEMILADEPTSDLDSRTEKEVMGILRDINSTGVTFMLVTHSLSLIAYASRAFRMEDGILTDVTHLKGMPYSEVLGPVSQTIS